MDLIDRQEVLAETGKWLNDLLEDESAKDIRVGIRMVRVYIKQMPSAQPEERTEKRTETHACDLISRKAAIDAIEQMQIPIMRSAIEYEQFIFKGMSEALNAVKDLPSVQPDIIRCRNCKFASGDSRICMKFDHSPIGELDFCAWAERRTDE